MSRPRTYLDWNASAPLRPEARVAMIAALELAGNPSSVHAEGRAARAAVETAREQVAALVGARASEVVFTSGATEANALVLGGRAWNSFVSSGMEHPSVAAPAGLSGELCIAAAPDGRCALDGAVGPLRALGEMGRESGRWKHGGNQGWPRADSRVGRCRRQLARQVAITAVVVESRHLGFLLGLVGSFSGLRDMLVTVVSEMRGVRRPVLAICSSRRPGILERQRKQQQDE